MPEPKNKDENSPLWDSLNELRQGEAKMSSRVAALETALRSVADVVNRIESRLAQPPPPTNWVGIGMLLVAVVGVFATYIQARFSPVERLLDKLAANDQVAVEHMLKDAEDQGGNERNDHWLAAQIDALAAEIRDSRARSEQSLEKSAAAAAELRTLSERVADIDNLGSRRWNKMREGGGTDG